MRKFLSILLSLLIVLPSALFGIEADETPAGTPIGTAEKFAGMDAAGTYYLSEDIELTASYASDFKGTLDGNGHKLTLNGKAAFIRLKGANVSNLTLEGTVNEASNTNGYVGALAEYGQGITVTGVTNNATVTTTVSGGYAGGLIGQMETGGGKAASHQQSTFTGCVNNGAITGDTGACRLGGIVGNSAKYQYCNWIDCVNNGTVSSASSSGSYVGGISGSTFGGKAEGCVNNGTISGPSITGWTGGIIARLTPSTQKTDQSVKFINCVNNGKIECETSSFTSGGYAGGITGGSGGTELKDGAYAVYSFDGCVNNGDVTCGGDYAGGIIGYTYGQGYKAAGNYQYSEIRNCVNRGNITGTKNVDYMAKWGEDPKTDPGKNPHTYVSHFIAYTNCVNTLIENSIGSGTLSSVKEDFQVVFGLSGANASSYKVSGNKVVAGTKNFSYAMDAYVKDSETSEYSLTLTATGDRSANRIPLTAELAEKVEILSEAEIASLLCAKGLHSVTKVGATAASCTVDGTAEHYACSGCGKLFSDEKGENELTTVVVPAAHTFTEDSEVCSVCGYPKDMSSLKAAYGTPVIDGTADEVWERAQAYAYEQYDYVTKKGTDVKPGQFRLLWDENYVYALFEINDATLAPDEAVVAGQWYTRDGIGVTICPFEDNTNDTSADAKRSFWFIIRTNGTGPNYSSVNKAVFITEDEATYADGNGSVPADKRMFSVTKSDTGYVIEAKFNIAAAGVAVGRTKPDDTNKTNVIQGAADFKLEAGTKFKFDTWTNDNAYSESNTAARRDHGYTFADRSVTSNKNNSKKATVELLEKPVHTHTLVKTDAVTATCETAGCKEYYTCSDCGLIFADAAGTTETTVEACAIEALGHKWGEWKETKAPTETAEGEMKRICGNDETHVQTIILSKLTVSANPVVSDELAAVESAKTPELIKSSFEAGAAAQEGFKDAKVKVVEVDLKVSLDGGTTFVPATNDIIPSSGIVITLPYPAGVDKDKNDFLVAHMLAAATAEHPAGYIEYLKPEKTAEGLKVTVYSVSPFAVIWTSNEQQQTTPVTGDGTVWFALLAVISLGGAVIGVRKAGKKD